MELRESNAMNLRACPITIVCIRKTDVHRFDDVPGLHLPHVADHNLVGCRRDPGAVISDAPFNGQPKIDEQRTIVGDHSQSSGFPTWLRFVEEVLFTFDLDQGYRKIRPTDNVDGHCVLLRMSTTLRYEKPLPQSSHLSRVRTIASSPQTRDKRNRVYRYRGGCFQSSLVEVAEAVTSLIAHWIASSEA